MRTIVFLALLDVDEVVSKTVPVPALVLAQGSCFGSRDALVVQLFAHPVDLPYHLVVELSRELDIVVRLGNAEQRFQKHLRDEVGSVDCGHGVLQGHNAQLELGHKEDSRCGSRHETMVVEDQS